MTTRERTGDLVNGTGGGEDTSPGMNTATRVAIPLSTHTQPTHRHHHLLGAGVGMAGVVGREEGDSIRTGIIEVGAEETETLEEIEEHYGRY